MFLFRVYSIKFKKNIQLDFRFFKFDLQGLLLNPNHQILYSHLVNLLRRRTPVCFKLLFVTSSFLVFFRFRLANAQYFSISQSGVLGGFLSLGTTCTLLAAYHGKMSNSAKTVRNNHIFLFQEKQQTFIKTLFHVNFLFDSSSCYKNAAFIATGLLNKIFLCELRRYICSKISGIFPLPFAV